MSLFFLILFPWSQINITKPAPDVNSYRHKTASPLSQWGWGSGYSGMVACEKKKALAKDLMSRCQWWWPCGLSWIFVNVICVVFQTALRCLGLQTHTSSCPQNNAVLDFRMSVSRIMCASSKGLSNNHLNLFSLRSALMFLGRNHMPHHTIGNRCSVDMPAGCLVVRWIRCACSPVFYVKVCKIPLFTGLVERPRGQIDASLLGQVCRNGGVFEQWFNAHHVSSQCC